MDPQTKRPRSVIVTGAAGGIGHAIAVMLAQRGWRLILTDRDESILAETRETCRTFTSDVRIVAGDVTREEDVARVVRAASDHYGQLDGFVSNAGIPGVVRPLEQYPVDDFRRVLEVNVTGTFLCLKHGLPAMQKTGSGSFVAMGSTSSIRGRANLAAYVASKHAVLGLVRTAALEHVGTTVRVNAVLPGPTQTAMIDSINSMAKTGTAAGSVQRAMSAPYGTPQHVAETVAFLLADVSSHMTGAALVLDGGSTLA